MEIYIILKLIWFVLLGVLLMGIAVMVGMDMGVGALLRFVGRNDKERRVALNIIGPHWDGNQVWFILGGGAIFAAFPTLYATSFSTFYVVMILLLFSMILRPVAFEYRSKLEGSKWRETWDWMFLISGALPMIIYGAAMGNVMQGVAYHFEWNGQYVLEQSFIWYLLNPFAILAGVLSLCLALQQGAAMLMIRSEDPIYGRAKRYGSIAGMIAAVLFVIGGVWVSFIQGFTITGLVDAGAPATPLHGPAVAMQAGAWLDNYAAVPLLWAVPAIGVIAMLAAAFLLRSDRPILGWWVNALAWVCTIGTVGVSMFPFLMPSTSNPAQSLTVWNASGSAMSLGWMLAMALIFVPAIIAYTSWIYALMGGKRRVTDFDDTSEEDEAY
ncbi:cytochrome d ubiquinol oxidase subunit II [Thioclava sp.]|uniref:cytochrome d ubiquinol oxidase subunit II n=1 Tax=Thioclava sp. TaxID=1933450 RepID=UPI003AA88F43